MLLRKERLAVFNKPAIPSGRIYQMDLKDLKLQLDEIIRRGWIGGTAVDQRVFHSLEKPYVKKGTPVAGALNRYTLENDIDGGITLYGDVTLSSGAEFFKNLFPDAMGFSINSLALQRIEGEVTFMTVQEIRGFDFVTLREIPEQNLESKESKDGC